MKWFCIIFSGLVVILIIEKLRIEFKKRKMLQHSVQSLACYLNMVEDNPFLNVDISNQAACFLRYLRASGYVISENAKISENNFIEYEMRVRIPEKIIEAVSTVVKSCEYSEKVNVACFEVMETLTGKALLLQELLGKKFIQRFISSFIPVFNEIDETGKEYAYVRILPIPGEEDAIFRSCCAITQLSMKDEETERTLSDWLHQHQNVCILFACGLLSVTVAAICIHFSDSFYVRGISHLRQYIALMGVPVGVEFQTGAVLLSILSILFIGVAVALFLICLKIALRPEDTVTHTTKVVLRRYLPILASIMLCVSVYLSVPFYSARLFWMNLLGEAAMKCLEIITEVTSPLLLSLCIIWSCVFLLGDILEDCKWLSVLALVVVCLIGVIAMLVLLYENISQLWYLIPHISTVIGLTTASGIWMTI